MALAPQQPYLHQIECFQRAKDDNTIIAIPTGKGKTLVAVLAIDHFLVRAPDKYLVFAVPTKNLVKQQAEYCEQNCRQQPPVAQLCGTRMDSWDGIQWRKCLRHHRLLVGTPEVFRRALASGYLVPERISLLIFDECHNATGNSPMAQIMKDSIRDALNPPRILGLTASFCHGRMKRKRDAEMAKILLEELLQAKIFCPTIAEDAGSPSKQWHTVTYPTEALEEKFGAVVETCMSALIQECDPTGTLQELHKVKARLKHVLGQLGREALIYCIKNNVVHHLTCQAADLAKLQCADARARSQAFRNVLPKLRSKLVSYANGLPGDAQLSQVPPISQKAVELCNLLQGKLAKKKGIVFVTQIMMTCPLANLIKEHVAGSPAEGLYGGMAEADRDAAIRRFREGHVYVLVATDMLLEGFDTPDCEWVVRFNEFHTTKSHIQGSGRARSDTAHVYYFENDPEEEQDKASVMESVARDPDLHVTPQYLQDRADQRAQQLADTRGVHPFVEPDCQPIHFFNGLDIVVQWCQQVLGEAMCMADLVKYAPGVEGGGLHQVKFPSPDGWKSVGIEEIDRHWGSVRIDDAVDRERCRNLNREDKERRRAFFVVAIRLRQLGLVDRNNEPKAAPLLHSKTTCMKGGAPPRRTIRNTFARAVPEVKSGNYKEALHELVQQRFCGPGPARVKDVLNYIVEQAAEGGFIATIVILDKIFSGDAQSTKGAAEQAAAQKAYAALAAA